MEKVNKMIPLPHFTTYLYVGRERVKEMRGMKEEVKERQEGRGEKTRWMRGKRVKDWREGERDIHRRRR